MGAEDPDVPGEGSESAQTLAPLEATPQRLGILPTWSFWRRGDIQRIVRVPLRVLSLGLGVGVGIATHRAGLGALAGVAGALAGVLLLGTCERILRWAVSRRRRRIARSIVGALPEGEGGEDRALAQQEHP